MDLRRLSPALAVAEVAAAATLLRSIAFDRWITVLASALLLAGIVGARRDRVWGIALAFAAAAAFPVAWAIGIAPAWFVVVGAAGALPFLVASPAMIRFDARATALLTALGAALGASGAIAWKEYALDVFAAVPALTPSVYAHHGAALLALLATAFVARRVALGTGNGARSTAGVRIASRLRVADVSEDVRAEEDAWQSLSDSESSTALRRRV